MDIAKLQELANEFAKGVKTQNDLNDFTKMITKLAVETALNAELTEHLGYEKHQNSPDGATNARNGNTKKRLKGIHGEIEIKTPVILPFCRGFKSRDSMQPWLGAALV